jgi:imidazolonepropionase
MKTLRAARMLTCDRGAWGSGALGVLADACVSFDAHGIHWLGPAAALPPELPAPSQSAALITPGLVDAHTHSAWMGSRHEEYVLRMGGASYQQLAAAGGGILASHRALIAASEDEVFAELRARLQRMAALGVTTVEVKSGYGLTREGELKQLRAMKRAAADPGLPRVVSTYLALHALPPPVREAVPLAASVANYVATMTGDVLDEIAREGLAVFVDAYVDVGAFTAEQASCLAERARANGIGVRLHCGQFADVGGLDVAARYAAASVDHMEHFAANALDALARAGTAAVLLPIASYTLRQRPPDTDALRRAGVRLVVASDANPGTAPSESLPLAMAMALRDYGLSTEEIWLGATHYAANTLRVAGRVNATGQLAVGAPADIVAWDAPAEACILQPWGTQRTVGVWRDGVQIA